LEDLEELLRRGRAGDRPALSALIQRYQGAVAGLVAAQLHAGNAEQSQCEDLCQTVFVKMVLRLGRLREPQAFEGWLFQIARNVCRDHLRVQTWRRRLFEPFLDRHATVASPLPSTAEAGAAQLQRAIARLDTNERALVSLTLEGSRSYAELAELLGLTVAATKSRLFRTRRRLGQLIREVPNDEP
jgi:RNA polymerase sigma-70 factor (ECF subfamily)